MSKHQVFLIHGMGKYDAGWSLAMQKEIRETFNQYGKVKALGLANRFDLVEIVYDDIFDKWRKQWEDDFGKVTGAMAQLNLNSAVTDALSDLVHATTGNSFWQTHVLDVVLYRFVPQFREEVNQNLRKKILAHLNAFPPGQLPQWSAMAHSLGTSVLHNTLQGMFTQQVDGVLLGDAYMPAYLFMIANVSKVLWSLEGNFYDSAVKPHPVETMGMCWRYCTFRHALDPIPLVDAFKAPASWFPDFVDRKQIYAEVVIPKQDVQDFNVHGLSHYWSHPDVHVEIIETLANIPNIITNDEYKAQLKKWRDNTLAKKALQDAQDKLLEHAGVTPAKWDEVVKLIQDFRAAVLAEGLDKREGETPS